MSSKLLLKCITALTAVVIMTSCEKEEEVARSLSGTWETSDQLFVRTYKGSPLKTTKTVFVFINDGTTRTVGNGYSIEYYDSKEMPVAYFYTNWETWTRKNGDVGIEVKYTNPTDKFSTTNYSMKGNDFSGKCHLNDGSEQNFKFTRTTSTPDISKVKYWGYDELVPTWNPISYEGVLDVRRTYQGKTYKPTSVVITFESEPEYNKSMVWYPGRIACVKENYDNAPWGTYLADSLREWRNESFGELDIWFAHSTETFGDYKMWNVKVNKDSLAGDLLISTNVFTHFNMKRVANPDWSAIKEWGITNRVGE